MANPVCSTTTLIDNASCYRSTVLNPIQQMSMLVYGMVLELAAIGGTDYRTEMTGDLLDDTAALTGIMTKDQLIAGLIARQFANATAASATVPDTLDEKMTAIKCLETVPGGIAKLEQIYLLLFCRLGTHKAYTQ